MEHNSKYYSKYKKKAIRAALAFPLLALLAFASLLQPCITVSVILFILWILSFFVCSYYVGKLCEDIEWEWWQGGL